MVNRVFQLDSIPDAIEILHTNEFERERETIKKR